MIKRFLRAWKIFKRESLFWRLYFSLRYFPSKYKSWEEFKESL